MRARDCSGKPEVCWLSVWPDLEWKAQWPCVSLGHDPKLQNCFAAELMQLLGVFTKYLSTT
jgi:hypothetical protein